MSSGAQRLAAIAPEQPTHSPRVSPCPGVTLERPGARSLRCLRELVVPMASARPGRLCRPLTAQSPERQPWRWRVHNQDAHRCGADKDQARPRCLYGAPFGAMHQAHLSVRRGP